MLIKKIKYPVLTCHHGYQKNPPPAQFWNIIVVILKSKCLILLYNHGSQCFWNMPNNDHLENCRFFHETHQLFRGLKCLEPEVFGSRFFTFLKMTGIKIFKNPPPHWHFLQDRLPRWNPTSTEMGFIHIRVINLCPLDGALVYVCTLGQLILT